MSKAVSPRQQRRGPAPIASFDHDVASFDHDDHRPDISPESKSTAAALSEIREERLAPRIELSRASSSSPQESRDSSPGEFREDAAELRASTEELAFLDEPQPTATPRDSLTSHISLPRTPRLSVTSATSRSPSPHRMILETSFCGPKPIDAELDVTAAQLEERLILGTVPPPPADPPMSSPAPPPTVTVTVTTAAQIVSTTSTTTATSTITTITSACEEKMKKETTNRARAEMRTEGKGRDARRASSAREGRDIVRIRLKPPDQYEDDSSGEEWGAAEPRKPITLEIGSRGRSGERAGARSAGASPARRKSSWSSLFRRDSSSRERPRRGSVLSLLRSPRRSSRSPPAEPPPPPAPPPSQEPLIVYIPLRPPTDESSPLPPVPPASTPLVPALPVAGSSSRSSVSSDIRLQRTVLPDGSIIIPLHSPTERVSYSEDAFPRAPSVTSPHTPVVTIEHSTQVHSSSDRDVLPTADNGEKDECDDDKQFQKTVEAKDDKSDVISVVEVTDVPQELATATGQRPVEEEVSESLSLEDTKRKRKQHIVFTTKMGSREEVFTTQLSITKTPSVSSDKSVSSEDQGWEGSWEERAGLVQEPRDELPWVPTTLPQERPSALPIVPVRDRTPRPGRPRAPRSPPPPPRAPPPGPPGPALPPLRVVLPTRPAPWVDVSQEPERRRAVRRIQTLPEPPGPAYTYVEPDLCRCECHANRHHNSESGEGNEEMCGETAPCIGGGDDTRTSTSQFEDVFGDH